MRDMDWLSIIVVLIVGLLIWRNLTQRKTSALSKDQAPRISTPPASEPKHKGSRPIGRGKSTRSPKPPSAEPKSPPQIIAPAPTATGKRKRGWLIGPERVAWQKEQQAKQDREREEDREARREEAKRKAEEKRAKDEEERRRSLQEAERRNAEEEERRRRMRERGEQDKAVGRDFAHYIARPVPADIKRSMREFLAGQFVGSDRSPLAYVGYHVGVTNGLRVRDRERRMEVCFQIDIPPELRADYASWGGPGSKQRLNAMCGHLGMLAAMRRDRPGYELAVAEWERDKVWLKEHLGGLAERFTSHGVTY